MLGLSYVALLGVRRPDGDRHPTMKRLLIWWCISSIAIFVLVVSGGLAASLEAMTAAIAAVDAYSVGRFVGDTIFWSVVTFLGLLFNLFV